MQNGAFFCCFKKKFDFFLIVKEKVVYCKRLASSYCFT